MKNSAVTGTRALVFSIDDNYMVPFKVLWHSLLANSAPPQDMPLFILHDNSLSGRSQADLQKYLARSDRKPVFCDMQSAIPQDFAFPLSDNDHVSIATYFRLFLASILPNTIDSVLYLDSDLLIVKGVEQLYNMEFSASVAAADHLSPDNAFRIWGDEKAGYFQAGVLLVNVEKWRRINAEVIFQNILRNKGSLIRWWDQDVLNLAFPDDWQQLPIWYNTFSDVIRSTSIEIVRQNARIIHFDGSIKPWRGYPKRTFAQEWFLEYQKVFGKRYKIPLRFNRFLRTPLSYLTAVVNKLRTAVAHASQGIKSSVEALQ